VHWLDVAAGQMTLTVTMQAWQLVGCDEAGLETDSTPSVITSESPPAAAEVAAGTTHTPIKTCQIKMTCC